MAYSENLALRIRDYFGQRADVEEKKMFGGIAFMVSGHMCIGVRGESIVARIGPDNFDKALSKPGTRQMDFTGRPSKGFVYVSEDVLPDDHSLKSCDAFADVSSSFY